ncbi:MAG: shikimate dehydrogenase [Methylotenera sp.]|jgi:shikimate dehydrogenase|nr:shikimate dehydrogenase [Methylotenera sp.]
MLDKYAEPLSGIDRYAVVGNPIAHSKSPLIHAAFAKQTHQNISYERVLAPLDGFEATIKDLIKQGFKGVNVTVPFKFEAYALCDYHTEQAKLAGAVNTIKFTEHGLWGSNTDGDGLIADITHNLKTSIEGKRVLLLGAGGAAEGVFQPLLVQKPAKLVVANRTLDKAEKMVSKSLDKTVQGAACTYDDLKNQQFDIVVNATSAGLSNMALPIPSSVFAKNCLAYDMMYGRETPFMQQARANGAQVADGLGMLVEQAAEAFSYWRGVRPETKSVMKIVSAL